MATYPHTKDRQLETYISQFIRVFSGFQVEDGVARNNGQKKLTRVPVVYGPMDRVVAHQNTKGNFLNRGMLPIISVNMTGLSPNPDRKMSSKHIDETVNRSIDANEYSERIIGPPFVMNMEVYLWASSIVELFELLEQVLLVFNPRVAIQTSSDGYDTDYITSVELTGIQPEIQNPIGQEKRIVILGLTFEVPIRLKYPYGLHNNIIEQITLNVKNDNTGETIDTATIDDEES